MTELLIGGYTADMGGIASGIGRARTHGGGRFEYLGPAATTDSPSWVRVDGARVYATLEGASAIEAFSLVDGQLTSLGRAATPGELPCHLAVSNGAAIVACYGDGVVNVHPVTPGGVAGASQRIPGEGSGPLAAQEGPHAHHVLPLPDGRVLTLDLGADRIHVHRWIDGTLTRTSSVGLPPGTTPRDLLPLPDGRILLLGEWSCELVLLAEQHDGFGIVQRVAIPGTEFSDAPSQASGLGIAPDGRTIVAALRGANRIATLAYDRDGGVQPIGSAETGGDWPRHFLVDGDYVHVANQLSSTVTSFQIYPDGSLASVGDPVAVPSPTCLVAIP